MKRKQIKHIVAVTAFVASLAMAGCDNYNEMPADTGYSSRSFAEISGTVASSQEMTEWNAIRTEYQNAIK